MSLFLFKDKANFLGTVSNSRLPKLSLESRVVRKNCFFKCYPTLYMELTGIHYSSYNYSLVLSKLDHVYQVYVSASEKSLDSINSIHNEGFLFEFGV